jgi:iron complex outermembrane receptor protein
LNNESLVTKNELSLQPRGTKMNQQQCVYCVVLSLATSMAGAQDRAATNGGGFLDEVVVTARRVEENLQTTPVTVSAFGAEQLDKLPVTRTEDLGAYIPNFNLTRGTSNPATLNVTLRGSGEGAGGFATSEPPIAFYLNDVYQARLSGINMEFLDIERIEVLRGPQGTLFGRNSTSGAVNIITRKPGQEFRFDSALSVGSYEEYKVKAAISGPLIDDRLAASFSFVKADQGEGYKDNIVTGTDQDKLGFEGARLALNWIGSENFEAGLNAYYSKAENDGFVPIAIDTVTLQPLTGDFFKSQTPNPSLGDTQTDGVNVRFSWDVGPVTVKSISAYAAVEDAFRFDLSGGIQRANGTYFAGFDRTSAYEQDQFTQEIQLLSNSSDSRLSWIAGAYYFTEDVEQTLDDVLLGFLQLPLKAYEASTDSASVFGQVTWQASDRVGLTLGVRHTEEDKDISGSVGTAPLANETSYSATTPKISIAFEYSDDIFFFASIARGFKAGGFNGGGGNVLAMSTPFDEENVTSYEIGSKTEWFDRRLRVNATLFFAALEDLQGGVFIPGTINIVTENAFDVDQVGLELDITAAPTDRLEIFAIIGWQDEDFKNFKPGAQLAANPPQRRPAISHEQATIGFNYTIPIASTGGSLRFGSDLNYRDSYWSAPTNNIYSKTPPQARINANVSYLSPDEHWRVELEARNLTDEVDWYAGLDLTGPLGSATQTPLPPRWWTLSVRYRY